MTQWQQIRDRGFAVPGGESVTDLVAELVEMLASPDPTIRDEIAFSAVATWIDDGVLTDAQLRDLGAQMAERFQDRRVQARTFAPLVLDVIVSCRGVCEPDWVDAFERWYASEQDLRGHDTGLGWLHAVAHGADLLGDAGRRKDVGPGRMLDLAAARMVAPTDAVWHDQEPDRLACAMGKVLTRPDLDEREATAWLDPVARLLSDGEPGPVPPQVSNTLHTLRTLYLAVDRGIRIGPDEVIPVPQRATILTQVAAVLRPATPWMY
ncbi:DUF2785 domain-containing protein [Leekyejoonella antrihumi]|uniref:DUF2785 domain-containing protein n=1 Tax=Leekyejoonella antrihumi TaxID=1660198 RepID=A0A563DUP5_9MICO|nr:DUF2785 domain-containing protein [Leekyejoonella antrihumi]TWP33899.1 DUF2785 domain-containing protein [Leekyejoonella antrihumi]